MMKIKAVLSFLLCTALIAGIFVLPAASAQAPVTNTFESLGGTTGAIDTTQLNSRSARLYFNANGGTGSMASLGADFEGWVTVPACTFARSGYTFTRWNTASDGSGTSLDPGTFIMSLTTDMTLYAQWIINRSTITFNSKGGNSITPITQDEGTVVIAPANPTKTDYTFMGWVPGIPATMPIDDIICVAQWEPIPPSPTSTITFDMDDGSPMNLITQVEGTSITPPADPIKPGYIFMGWEPLVPATMPVDDVTCVAQWRIQQDPSVCETIHFDLGGGSWGYDPYIGHDEGDPILAPPDPTREGYVFAGWVPCPPAYCPVDDITCVAQWEPIPNPTSTITFDTAGGTAVAPITQNVGSAVFAPEDPSKAGFAFVGWEPPLPANMPADDITCVAQWEPIIQEPDGIITLDPNGGKWHDGSSAPRMFYYVDGILVPWSGGWTIETGDDGMPVLPPEDPTREGYTFMGWMPCIPATIPVGNMTCYAQWEENPGPMPIICFDTDGGIPVIAPITLDESEVVTAPPDPTKVGYIFTGWSPAVPAIMPAYDVTCVAQWRLFGDLDNNGSITSIDALMTLQGSSGEYVLSALQLLAADANHDGRISAIDALMLLHAASGLIML